MISEWLFCILVFFVSGYRIIHDYHTEVIAGEIIRISDDWAHSIWMFVALVNMVTISSLIRVCLE